MSGFKFTELQEKWLTALESGEYQQCVDGSLCEHSGYCCLGVCCIVLGYTPEPERSRLFGLRSASGELANSYYGYPSLARMNDSEEFSFSRIAAYIRANPENVFVSGAQ